MIRAALRAYDRFTMKSRVRKIADDLTAANGDLNSLPDRRAGLDRRETELKDEIALLEREALEVRGEIWWAERKGKILRSAVRRDGHVEVRGMLS